jgi:hypothetical protein
VVAAAVVVAAVAATVTLAVADAAIAGVTTVPTVLLLASLVPVVLAAPERSTVPLAVPVVATVAAVVAPTGVLLTWLDEASLDPVELHAASGRASTTDKTEDEQARLTRWDTASPNVACDWRRPSLNIKLLDIETPHTRH